MWGQGKYFKCQDSFFISDKGLCSKCLDGYLPNKAFDTCDRCLKEANLDIATGCCKQSMTVLLDSLYFIKFIS